MSKKVFVMLLSLVILLSMVLTACQVSTNKSSEEPVNSSTDTNIASQEKTQETQEKTQQAQDTYYPYIGALLELPYFIDHRVGLELAGKYWGVKTATVGPNSYDMIGEAQTIEQQIAQNPKAMFVSAFEDTLSPSINSAVQSGIPVFTIDMDTVKSDRQVFIGGDTVGYGRIHAKAMAEALNGKGEIVLMYNIGQNSQDQRAFGFKDEIKKYPDIKIVAEQNGEKDSSKDADAFKATLQAHPEIDGIATLVSTGAVAAATAVRELDRTGKILIVGDSKDEATLKLVEAGEVYATVAIKTKTETWYAAMLADGLAKNNISISEDDKAAGINALPTFVDIGTFVIKKDTAKYFYLDADPFDYSNFKVRPTDKNETYYLIGGLLELPYFIDHGKGFEAACKELGVIGKYVGPSGYDMMAEAQAIEQAIAEKPAGILVMAFEDTLAPAINEAIAAGIPVVTIDMDTLKSDRNFFVGGDTVEYGRIHARAMAKALNEKGEIVLMYNIGQNSQDQRAFGFKDEIKKYPGIKIVAEQNGEKDSSKDADAFKATLQAHPEINGIATLVSTGAVAAAAAVRELDKTGKIAIVGDSKDDATLQLLEKGEISATVAIKTAIEPYIAMKMLYLYNHTNMSISKDDKAAGVNVLPDRVDIGTFVITKETAKYFYLKK